MSSNLETTMCAVEIIFLLLFFFLSKTQMTNQIQISVIDYVNVGYRLSTVISLRLRKSVTQQCPLSDSLYLTITVFPDAENTLTWYTFDWKGG